MKNRRITISIILSLISFTLVVSNFIPTKAQDMFIDVMGGGYKIKGPETIKFQSKPASFYEQYSYASVRDQSDFNYIEITNENGGNPFTLTVSARDFINTQKPRESIENSGKWLSIQNCDQKSKNINTPIYDQNYGTYSPQTDTNCKTTLEGESSWANIDSNTNDFQTLDQERVLFSGLGQGPGQYRIYPAFLLTIPANTAPGTYTSTITFTIT